MLWLRVYLCAHSIVARQYTRVLGFRLRACRVQKALDCGFRVMV